MGPLGQSSSEEDFDDMSNGYNLTWRREPWERFKEEWAPIPACWRIGEHSAPSFPLVPARVSWVACAFGQKAKVLLTALTQSSRQ